MSVEVIAKTAPRLALARRRPAVSGTVMLSAAMVVSGVLTYAFHVLAARRLGPDAYGQIAVLWGAMFLAAIVLFRPVEQTTSRALADRLARGEEVRSVGRSAATMAVALVIGALILTVVVWTPLTNRLFVGDATMTSLLVAGVAAYGLSYLVRGFLGGTRWFGGYSLGLTADAVARLVVAAPLVVVASKVTAGVAVVCAGIAGAVVPLVVGRRRLAVVGASGTGARFSLRDGLSFAAPATVIAAADQLFVNGGPLLVIAAGGAGATRSAGIVFAATMLVRAPVYVFQGLAAALLPNLTHLQATDDRAPFRRAVLRTCVFLLGCGAVLVVGLAVAGSSAMGILYGKGFDASTLDLVALGAGIGLYLAASTVSQALLALDTGRRTAAGWAVSAAVFVLLFAVLPGSDLGRVSVAFTGATLVLLVALAVQLDRRTRR